MKTKVCHLTSVHSASDTRIFIKECKTLAKFGFDVHLIAPDVLNQQKDHVYIHGIPKFSDNRFVRMTKRVHAVYKKAINIDAEIYHFHDPELIPVGLKLRSKGKKVIYDIHEDVPRAILSKKWIPKTLRKLTSFFLERLENFSAKKFDFLICATPHITKRFKKLNANTVNVNNYPLLDELKNNTISNVKPKNNNVCYVGGITKIRGIIEIIQAAKKIKGTILLGGPIETNEIKELILKTDNIIYKGVLSRIEVKELFSQSIAGLVTFLPEPNHIYAQPNKMFEYMSASLPIICSNFSLWKNIIEKHHCGITVNPNNPNEIAQAINYLFDHPSEAKRMGINGRKAVEDEYNWEKESEKLINVYQQLES